MTHAFQPIGNGYLHLRSVREKEKGRLLGVQGTLEYTCRRLALGYDKGLITLGR